MPRDNLHRCHTGSYDVEHRDVHNVYGFYHHMASVLGQLKRSPDVRPFVLTRSFFAGSHRHGPVWTGDNMANWDHLARSVPMLVSLSVCGLSLAGADVPGFFGDPTPELFARWHQLGVWYPFYRGHAHLTTKRREPWVYGDHMTQLVRNAVRTRYRMLPMWYTLAAEWSFKGSPMLRPLWYHALSDDEAYQHTDDHFLVGESLLVRAVTEELSGMSAAEVYLPSGSDWFDFWNASGMPPRKGGLSPATVRLSETNVPVFVRGGSILPQRRRPRRSSAAMAADPYTLEVFGDRARGSVYADDGQSHGYLDGSYVYDEAAWDGKTFKISQAVQGFKPPEGMSPPKQEAPLPVSALRVERLIFHGLSRQPKAVQLIHASQEPQGLQIDVRAGASGEDGQPLWTATVKATGVHLGPPYDWSVEFVY